MDSIRNMAVLLMVVVGLVAGCASAEPEIDNDDNSDQSDVGVDGDTDVGSEDPCDRCPSDEACIDDQCVDVCAQQQRECGIVDYDDNQFDCGDCSLGNCQEGQCSGVCEELIAECGEIYYQGALYDCSICGGGDRCTQHHRCIESSGYVGVAAGRHHSCALDTGGSVDCWGDNEDGQLGDGSSSGHSTQPVSVAGLNTVSTLSSINNHSCASLDNQSVYCWGANRSGRLGDGTTDEASIPVEVSGVSSQRVAAGGSHTCSVTSGGELECWGDNDQGQLGAGEEPSEPGEIRRVLRHIGSGEVLDGVVDVSLGSAHSCAVDEHNELWCWGRNHRGQLGLGNNVDEPAHAHRVGDLESVVYIEAGFDHTCALTGGGQLWCWGSGDDGQIGDEEMSSQTSPTHIDFDEPVVDVGTGRYHTCAVVQSGQTYCWGRNQEGQLGIGLEGDTVGEPQEVVGLDDVVQVDAGGYHSCALDRRGDIHCWGRNDEGQLGDGSTSMRTSPASVN